METTAGHSHERAMHSHKKFLKMKRLLAPLLAIVCVR